MYNRNARYGQIRYNRGTESGEGLLRLGTAGAKGGAARMMLKGDMLLFLRAAQGQARAVCFAVVALPLVLLPAEAAAGANLCWDVLYPLPLSPADGQAGAAAMMLRTTITEDILLDGIEFAPGDVLILDTDRITVEKNGVNAMEYWRVGSVSFSLAPGLNAISWWDSETGREVQATVIWQERWV